MSRRTLFGGLLELEPGDGLFDENADFTLRNIETIARMLRIGAVTHRHDGHAALADPDPLALPTLALDAVGGQLPPGAPIFVGYTLLDADGGETLISALVNDVTPVGLTDFPASPTVAVDYTAGTLPANTYYYVLTATDAAGGETDASDPATAVVAPGQANARVVLDGLMTAAAAVGGVGWRLYRSTNGGQLGLLGQGATEGFTDDGQPCLDPQLQPPVASTAGGTGQARITVPGPLPADAAGFRLYVSPVDTFDSPSLVGDFLPADASTEIVVQSFGLQSGAPPLVSTALPGAEDLAGGGGGLFSYPWDSVTTLGPDGGWSTLDGYRLLVGEVTSGAPPVLLRDGTAEYRYFGGPFISNDSDSTGDAGAVERPISFFDASVPGIRDGTVTVKFQLDAVASAGFSGSVSALIGHQGGPRAFGRLTWDGAGGYDLQAGIEEPFIDADMVSVPDVPGSPVLAVDTDYWLRVTRDGNLVGAALYDADPSVGPAVPLLEVVPTAVPPRWDWAFRTNALPGFGWAITDTPANRIDLVRFYELHTIASSGGEGYDPPIPRLVIIDSGDGTFTPASELKFVGLGVNDERPKHDRITVSAPGMHQISGDDFVGIAFDPSYLTQNVALDNQDVKAAAAGNDGRVVIPPAPGWWTVGARATFVGVAADDKFGVMLKTADIDSFLLVRVNNTTAAPALEIVDVNNNVETVLRSIPIAQIITGSAANWWDVPDPVWVVGEINQDYIAASIYNSQPDYLETATPFAHLGVKLTGAVSARYAVQGAWGMSLVPAAGGGNTLRGTSLYGRTAD